MTKEQYIEYSKDPIKFITDFRVGTNAYNKFKVEKLPIFEFEKSIISKLHKEDYTIFKKSRQMHFSSIVASYVCWCTIFSHKKYISIISPNSGMAKNFLEKVRLVLQKFYKEDFKENTPTNNLREIVLKNGSEIISSSVSKNPGCAQVSDLIIFDEFSFFEDSDQVFTSAIMTLSQDRGKCILYSSVRYKDDAFYKIYDKAIKKENGYNAHEFLWSKNPNNNISWYEEIKNKFPQTYRQEYDCEPINKPSKKKENVITLRIDDWMDQEINKRLLQKSAEFKENYSISTYIRELIMKDLSCE